MKAIVDAIKGLLARLTEYATVKWIAFKTLIWTTVTTVIPLTIYNLICKILDEVITWANSQMNNQGIESATVQLTSLGGWVATQIQLPAAIAIILSAVTIKVVLNITRILR
jgi:hypothetical protein